MDSVLFTPSEDSILFPLPAINPVMDSVILDLQHQHIIKSYMKAISQDAILDFETIVSVEHQRRQEYKELQTHRKDAARLAGVSFIPLPSSEEIPLFAEMRLDVQLSSDWYNIAKSSLSELAEQRLLGSSIDFKPHPSGATWLPEHGTQGLAVHISSHYSHGEWYMYHSFTCGIYIIRIYGDGSTGCFPYIGYS